MKTSFWLAGFALCLSTTSIQPAQAATPADSVDLFLTAKMRQLRIPGLQLAVVRHGQVVKLAQYGLASVQDSVPVTRRTLFAINSITKAFVGVAVMQLVEAGKLDLAAPVGRYLPGLPVAWQPATIRQLLSHTSGLPDIMPDGELLPEGTEAAAWAALQLKPLDFPPGQRFSYNQTNYLLLGKIIDQLSGQPFAQVIEDRQLQPVGMLRTTFGDARDVFPQSARSYTFTRMVDGEVRRTPQLYNLFDFFPPVLRTAAGLNSTAEEMARWLIALQAGRLLKPASLPVLWAPAQLNDGTQRGFSPLLNGYALGWPTITRPEHPAVAPVGGGKSAVFVYPNDDLAVVVLTNLNGANPDRFIDEIASYYLPDMRVADGFGLPANLRALHRQLRQRGFSHALELVRKEQKQNPAYRLPEAEVNSWGYLLVKQHQLRDALEIFKLNVTLNPQSANTYDSLAETYQELGNEDLAIRNYRQALKLDPTSRNAAEQLKRLQ